MTDDINLSASILQDEYLGLRITDLLQVELLPPLYKGIKQCPKVFLNAGVEIPSLVFLDWSRVTLKLLQSLFRYA